jgi:hypothetical protein
VFRIHREVTKSSAYVGLAPRFVLPGGKRMPSPAAYHFTIHACAGAFSIPLSVSSHWNMRSAVFSAQNCARSICNPGRFYDFGFPLYGYCRIVV